MFRLLFAIILYIIIVVTIVFTKPAIMFNSKGEIKKWGLERDENTSIFSLMVVLPLIAIVCYYVGACIEFM